MTFESAPEAPDMKNEDTPLSNNIEKKTFVSFGNLKAGQEVMNTATKEKYEVLEVAQYDELVKKYFGMEESYKVRQSYKNQYSVAFKNEKGEVKLLAQNDAPYGNDAYEYLGYSK